MSYLQSDRVSQSVDGNSMQLLVGEVLHFAPQDLCIFAAVQPVPHLQHVCTQTNQNKQHIGIFKHNMSYISEKLLPVLNQGLYDEDKNYKLIPKILV